MSQVTRKCFIVIEGTGPLDWTVASEYLPDVGDILVLGGPDGTYRVKSRVFYGQAELASFTNISGFPEMTIPEKNALTPVLTVELVP
ncbi:MAG: hypothetical protein ABL962_09750 [Fimbriimonadaceae bacterium]